MDWFFEQPLVLQVIIVVIFIIGVWQGYISVSWITLKKTTKRHEDCPLYPEFLSTIASEKEKSAMIANAPYILIRDQMTQTEDIEDDIKSILSAHYLKLLKKHRDNEKSGLIKDAEYQDYMHIIDLVMERVKKKVLTFYRENHLAEMSEIEFRAKTKERTRQITNIFTMEMNTIYSSRMDITREEVYEHNQLVLPEIENKLEDMFVKAKSLALEAKERLQNE